MSERPSGVTPFERAVEAVFQVVIVGHLDPERLRQTSPAVIAQLKGTCRDGLRAALPFLMEPTEEAITEMQACLDGGADGSFAEGVLEAQCKALLREAP